MAPPQLSLSEAHLRIARPTRNIEALRSFYIDGLGFKEIFSFKNHDGYDGVMWGHPDTIYHLEFTTTKDLKPEQCRAPSDENMLVFYHPDLRMWRVALERMEKAGYQPVHNPNPYWEVKGRTFEDADGWRVVHWMGRWNSMEVMERYSTV